MPLIRPDTISVIVGVVKVVTCDQMSSSLASAENIRNTDSQQGLLTKLTQTEMIRTPLLLR